MRLPRIDTYMLMCVGFLSARLATGILDTVLMWFFVSVIRLDDTLSKIIINILVIIIKFL